MATARAELIDLSMTSYYHCVSRCVRGSYLCGKDHTTGKDYSHRKEWIEQLINDFSQGFAIQVAAYAIMSNHYHIVLHVDVDQSKHWTSEDIKRRYKAILPKSVKKLENDIEQGAPKQIVENTIKIWHARLTDISWYMRCLNERIARWANQEDDCTGRFWEGRFKSQALLDQAAILSAMAYVDLNPVRAKMAITPENSAYTSINTRLSSIKSKKVIAEGLMPFYDNNQNYLKNITSIECAFDEYLKLIDASGRIIKSNKRGYIPDGLPNILDRLDIDVNDWVEMVDDLETGFGHAVGSSGILRFSGFRKKNKTKHNPFRQRPPMRSFSSNIQIVSK